MCAKVVRNPAAHGDLHMASSIGQEVKQKAQSLWIELKPMSEGGGRSADSAFLLEKDGSEVNRSRKASWLLAEGQLQLRHSAGLAPASAHYTLTSGLWVTLIVRLSGSSSMPG